jgi:pyruvate dehydrogenase E2 component (dihydrolipoamide acetyltransferase)
MSPLRQTIARRTVGSWSTIPHVTQFAEADISGLLELKQRHEDAYERQGAALTLTGFLVKAVVGLLKAHPKFNASLDEASQAIVLKSYYHIGIAVDTEAGLVVPVLKEAETKSLLTLSKELSALAERTRRRQITSEELQGGTFTISNQGGLGGSHFTPIIKQPEVAILGVGRSTLKPAVRQGAVEPRMLLPLALSYDHRVIDGAEAARFIRDLVQALEQFPESDVRL